LNFQRAYAGAIRNGMTIDAAKQFAISDISFGRSRAARGYGDFSVEVSDFEAVDLGGSLGTQNVPTKIKIEARRSR
jgi:hypothetical protein